MLGECGLFERPDKEQFHLSVSDESAFNAMLMWILKQSVFGS
jgi:hypothetical protein